MSEPALWLNDNEIAYSGIVHAGVEYYRIILSYSDDRFTMYGIGLDGDWNELSRHEIGIVVILGNEVMV